MINSKIIECKLTHKRLQPIQHAFVYNIYLFAFDLDELEYADKNVFGFSYNKINLISISDKDYLTKEPGSIKEKLLLFLKNQNFSEKIERVVLITAARYLNYAFNPVNFYYCMGENDSFKCIIAEVNNTFNERHIYLLKNNKVRLNAYFGHFAKEKEFYVSPFNQVEGEYEFFFSDINKKLSVKINYFKNGKLAFFADMQEKKAFNLNSKSLLKTVLLYPISPLLTMARIYKQAFVLYFCRKLAIFKKPNPQSAMTIGIAPPTKFQNFYKNQLIHFLKKIKWGNLKLILPDSSEHRFGDSNDPQVVEWHIHDYDFFKKVVFHGEMGLGESYLDKDWDTNNLTKLIEILIINEHNVQGIKKIFHYFNGIFNYIKNLKTKNNIIGAQKNIQFHYDLSNEMYSLFLDPKKMYSCGIFDSSESLEKAQINKINAIIGKLELKSSDRVLEIGCGWGSFAIEAVKQTGCHVTGITLSKKQLEYAKKQVKEAGLEDKIDLLLCDYRHVEGTFDKIVSIEMFEAVGQEYWKTFFSQCDKLLKKEGLFFLQTITVTDQHFANYLPEGNWINKYIFPGGYLPSLTELLKAIRDSSSFNIQSLENIGLHYAKTLRAWRDRFLSKEAEVRQLGFDERFIRTWVYYLSICEAGFLTELTGDLQLVLKRPEVYQMTNAII